MGHDCFALDCLHTGAVLADGPHAQRDTAAGNDGATVGRKRKG